MKAPRRSALTVLVMVLAVWLSGCGATPEERAAKGDAYYGRNDYQSAKRQYEKALSGTTDEARKTELQGKIKLADEGLARQASEAAAATRKREDSHKREALALLRQAVAQSEARQWAAMAVSIDGAIKHAKSANDAELNAQVNAFKQSQPVSLLRAEYVYGKMVRDAKISIIAPLVGAPEVGDVYEIGSIIRDVQLRNACAKTGDPTLSDLGNQLASQWNQLVINRNTIENADESTTSGRIFAMTARGLAAANIVALVKLQPRFEQRMRELWETTRLPPLTYRGPDEQPAAPVTTVVAATIAVPVQRESRTAPATRSQEQVARAATQPAAQVVSPVAPVDYSDPTDADQQMRITR